MKLDERSSYLTTFICQFGGYRYKRLLLGAAPARDMFQRKVDEIFKDFPDALGITDDILVVGYDRDRKYHGDTLQRALQRCRGVNLKLNKDKCHFRCTQVLFFFFGKIISRTGVKSDPWTLKAMTEIPPSKKTKKSNNHSLG